MAERESLKESKKTDDSGAKREIDFGSLSKEQVEKQIRVLSSHLSVDELRDELHCILEEVVDPQECLLNVVAFFARHKLLFVGL